MIHEITELEVSTLDNSLFDALIIQTKFSSNDIAKESLIKNDDPFLLKTHELMNRSLDLLKEGGLLFVYGLPIHLSHIGEYLNSKSNHDTNYLFKYWIACEFKPHNTDRLPHSHLGMLMYLKSKSKKNPTPFELNTKFVRIPYAYCPACKNMTKDWGGKKHMLNPLGSAISDVWSFPETEMSAEIPQNILDRISSLLPHKKILKINQQEPLIVVPNNQPEQRNIESVDIEKNKIINQDCIGYLKRLHADNPEGVFNLAFADPPYNLAKNYSNYKDDIDDANYIKWCNEWLLGMFQNLKPGGALLVLNIPKWAIYHLNFLSDKMYLKNWIVWDALSTPAGKLLPAHYSLLYLVKPGAKPTINIDANNREIDLRDYCLKKSCISKRKKEGNDRKEILTDVWHDVHRIKHKKDRDQHPCQLPTRLMERIISLFSNEGDLIFDPFGGAGTTAIASKLLNRDFIITEIDPVYVEIAQKNIEKIRQTDSGELLYSRESVKNTKPNAITKKAVETAYLNLCVENNKVLDPMELERDYSAIYDLILKYTGDFKKLQNIAKRKIEALNF